MNILRLLILSLSCSGLAFADYPIRNTIRDAGASFEAVKKWFSDSCGPVTCNLNDDDNCSLEFEDFYADGQDKPYVNCQLRLEVDLPDGWRMAPKAVAIEGDYQISEEGFAWLKTSYGLRGGKQTSINNYKSPLGDGEKPLSSGAFLLDDEIDDHVFSSCGGIAVFEGQISLFANKGRNDNYVTEVNLSNQKNQSANAEWGWVYQRCDMPKPPKVLGSFKTDHSDSIRGYYIDRNDVFTYKIANPKSGLVAITKKFGDSSADINLYSIERNGLKGAKLLSFSASYLGGTELIDLPRGDYYLELVSTSSDNHFKLEVDSISLNGSLLNTRHFETISGSVIRNRVVKDRIYVAGGSKTFKFNVSNYKSLDFFANSQSMSLTVYEKGEDGKIVRSDSFSGRGKLIYVTPGKTLSSSKTYYLRAEFEGSRTGSFEISYGPK